MSGYSKGAAAVIQALQATEDERETVWVDAALLAILNISPADSVLAHVLRMDSVWDWTMRQQLREGMSGKPGTEHLRARSMSGFRLQLLLEKAEMFRAEASSPLVEERHIASALAELLRNDLSTQGISTERFVKEVMALELSPQRERSERARELERLRFAKAQDEIWKEISEKGEAVRSHFAQAGHGPGSGTIIWAIVDIHATGLRRMAEEWFGIRKSLAQEVPDLAAPEQLDSLRREIDAMIDAQWANLHIAVARWVGGVSQEDAVRRILDSGNWQDAPLKIKAFVNREIEILRRDVELRTPLHVSSAERRSNGNQATKGKEGFEYDVAISYAGQQRELAEVLAKRVKEAGFEVFYDGFYREELWGKDLSEFFDNVYRKESRYCVIIASSEYLERMWSTYERRSAIARSVKERGQEYILPIMFEIVEIPGLPPTIGYVSLEKSTIEQIAEMLIGKLGKGRAGSVQAMKPEIQVSDGARAVLVGMQRNTKGRYPHSFWYKEQPLRLSVPNTDVVIEGDNARYLRDELLSGGFVEQWRPGIYRPTKRGDDLGKAL